MPADAIASACPPHHWDVGTADRVETWVCTRCGERRTVDRKALQAEIVPFTKGSFRKPDSVPPAATDIPAELIG